MKNFLILAILALLCNVSFSQTDTTAMSHIVDSLNNIADSLADDGNFREAIGLYSESAAVTKEFAGENSEKYASAVENIAVAYYFMGDYRNALVYYEKVVGIQKTALGEDHPDYAESLNNVAVLYSKCGDYQNSLKYQMLAMEIDKKINGEESSDYALSLNNLGDLYYKMNDIPKAMEYHTRALEIQKEVVGENHPDYARSLNNIGTLYSSIGEYKNALKYYFQAKDIKEKIIGTEHPDYATSLNNIGNVYKEMGDYQNALRYLVKGLEIRKKTLGKEHPSYAVSLINIGSMYSNMGDHSNALKYYIEAMNILKNTVGESSPNYATSMDNIGSTYTDIGDFHNALLYLNQAMEIRKATVGEESLDYANSINNLGSLYDNMGDYAKALVYYQQALELQLRLRGEEHLNYIISLNNVGHIYSEIGDYENALKYNMQSAELRKKLLGEDHPLYAFSLNNLGTIYNELGDYETALVYYERALKLMDNSIDNNIYVATFLNNVSVVYLKMGDYQKALEASTKSVEINKKILGEEHLDYAKSLNHISNAQYRLKNFSAAINSDRLATNSRKRNLISNFSFMTAHERESYWDANNEYFSSSIRMACNVLADTVVAKTAYDNELIIKGLLLASEISLTNTIMESGDSALISEYETMKTMHLQLNKELEKPIAERVYNCDSLENEIQKMERRIMEKSKEFGDVTHFIKIDWKEVQNSLKPNDVAIEFSNFIENDTTKFVALVLTKNMEAPICVPLFNNYEMQKLQRGIAPAKNETSTDEENRGATTVAAKRQGIYESKGLYDMLWKPLEKYFPENPRIYFAPSGMLHQIAVEYAPTGNGKTISDKYEIYRVSSTRFLAMDYMPKPFKNSVLYGGIYYDSDTTTMKQESNRYSTRSATSYTSFADFNRNEERGSLNYLPGTKTEVEDIVGKLKKKRIKSQLYEGSQANEESFKALSGSDISVLHIATHGFFLPTDEKLSGDQSLIQSGLLLSGANYAWQNKPLPEGVEDGILTAKEISFMDLRKTDLVVLSACQTALGEITGEGVFGLQRGFKKAGARTIIMSLWPVDDNATLLMMTEFYANLTKGMSKREAFLSAQNKVKTTAGFENPRYWAAFIMLDGNEN